MLTRALVVTSSHSEGWSYSGLTPGGLATDMYNGMVISPDEEIYMEGALLPFHPELAISAVQYRIDGGSAAKYNAKLFGHDGMQFPCNSAAKGFPHGCCGGKGTGTQCLSHHVTPTVVFSIQQAYRAIGNATWLREVAWPVVHGVSQWIVSRVTPHLPVSGEKLRFSLRGVEPIDQWCNPASGCLSSGVDDDPFTNAVAATALRFAIETAGLVGWGNRSEVTQWQAVADGLIIRYNTSLGVHTMGPGVVAAGAPHTFSCPEDVGYLSYPLGPSLNISAELRRRDLQYWQAYTCLENPGMTGRSKEGNLPTEILLEDTDGCGSPLLLLTCALLMTPSYSEGPIQAINWLKVSPPNTTGAERFFFDGDLHSRGAIELHAFAPLESLPGVRATNGIPLRR